ncbi:MAG: AAA family ATPase [Bacteroidota bacterium]
MDLKNFLRVLSRRKWIILAITGVAIATTYLIARQAPDVYKVSAQLSTGLADYKDPISLGESDRPLPRYELETRLKNLEETIKNPLVLIQVSYQLFLHDLQKNAPFRSRNELNSEFSPSELEKARRNFQEKLDSLQTLKTTNEIDEKHMTMLKRMGYDPQSLRSTLSVGRMPGTDLINISYSSESPFLSQFVANTLCQEFIRYHSFNRAEQSNNSIEFYNRQVKVNKANLLQKLREWENYRTQNGITKVNNNMNDLFERIERLEIEREKANTARQEAETIVEGMLTQANLNLPVSGQAYFTNVNLETDQDLAGLFEKFARSNYRFVASGFEDRVALDSLELLGGNIEEEMLVVGRKMNPGLQNEQRLVEAIAKQVEVELYRDRAKAINMELRRMSREPGSYGKLDEEGSVYAQEVERARDVYLVSLAKLNEAELTSQGIRLENITQVAFVQPPVEPEPSNIFLLSILAGLVALSLGILVPFVLEYMDTSVKFPSQFTSLTGLPLLGTLNELNTNNLDLISLFNETHKNKSLETYKQLLRKIRFEIVEQAPKNILVTSTKSGSGKTSLLVSLAYSLSLNGKKVLIMDTNFKNNSLTQIIGANPSLEKFLNEEISRRKLVSPTLFDGVDMIGCEGGNLSPSEVLPDEKFTELLNKLNEDYDFVIMEGPELNGYADSKELLKYASMVVPVFSADRGINQQDKASINFLRDHSNQLMGAILNKVDMKNLNL